jgi:hypothetical protein
MLGPAGQGRPGYVRLDARGLCRRAVRTPRSHSRRERPARTARAVPRRAPETRASPFEAKGNAAPGSQGLPRAGCRTRGCTGHTWASGTLGALPVTRSDSQLAQIRGVPALTRALRARQRRGGTRCHRRFTCRRCGGVHTLPVPGARSTAARRPSTPVLADRDRSTDQTRLRQPASKDSPNGRQTGFGHPELGENPVGVAPQGSARSPPHKSSARKGNSAKTPTPLSCITTLRLQPQRHPKNRNLNFRPIRTHCQM